ncbi:MAG TPA: hypothetical protein VGG64_23960 [Pirellulales bacterium]|jgi:hypothetical protein
MATLVVAMPKHPESTHLQKEHAHASVSMAPEHLDLTQHEPWRPVRNRPWADGIIKVTAQNWRGATTRYTFRYVP